MRGRLVVESKVFGGCCISEGLQQPRIWRAILARMSNPLLEDKFLRLKEENLFLKKTTNEQDEKIKKYVLFYRH